MGEGDGPGQSCGQQNGLHVTAPPVAASELSPGRTGSNVLASEPSGIRRLESPNPSVRGASGRRTLL
jgi:hypothetical protein